MKKSILLIAILITAILSDSHAQDIWTQKADYGGGQRVGSIGFSLGSKGYIGCGLHNLVSYYNDFWEYDPGTNTWTQKANFPAAVRHAAVSFAVDGKGYVGTGTNTGQYFKDFWEYDPNDNSWTQKADFGGNGRYGAVGFSIGGKGYIGTGVSNDYYIGSIPIHYRDFWEYDPANNTWLKKADFGGSARSGAAGFSIGSKGYMGTGSSAFGKKDFWEYDQSTNSWIQKPDFGGRKRQRAVGFSIGINGYIGTGINNTSTFNDFWRYNTDANSWIKIADFEGTPREGAVGFSVGSKGYIGTGMMYPDCSKDFWEYSPAGADTCKIPTSLSTVNLTSIEATLHWNAVSGAIGYQIMYKAASSLNWSLLYSEDNFQKITGLTANTNYAWQVKSVCSSSPEISSDGSAIARFTTSPFRLGADDKTIVEVYPNPISQTAIVAFSLFEESHIIIELMDLNGRSVRSITTENFSAGIHELPFDRASLATGIYFLQMKTGQEVMMKKVVVE